MPWGCWGFSLLPTGGEAACPIQGLYAKLLINMHEGGSFQKRRRVCACTAVEALRGGGGRERENCNESNYFSPVSCQEYFLTDCRGRGEMSAEEVSVVALPEFPATSRPETIHPA